MKTIIWIEIALILLSFGCDSEIVRTEIKLDGKWEITKTSSFSEIPIEFESKIPVPGLIDLATPALDTNKEYSEGVYWYKTTFTTNKKIPELAQLQIGKVKYHAKIYVNRQYVGEHLYCFTPGRFNIEKYLKQSGEDNEIVIGVGTKSDIPDTVMWGSDFEKQTYIPGIYDHVSLILSAYPFIKNIQVVPQIENKKARIVVTLDDGEKQSHKNLSYTIREVSTGEIAASGNSEVMDFEVKIPKCELWSPESPFLYELEVSTIADRKTVRFGMRSFSFDKKTGRAMLNGEPYFMRGTNVCILRFFEDPNRAELPWTDEWVIKLHEQFKSMNWNSIRYCIGLPPERWYEIADSLGFLIQNEYPVWTGVDGGFEQIYPKITASHLASEYRSWLPEHWNHPSVVIWDAQNESVTELTGQAISLVREMDLSNRPWDNGWGAPDKETDGLETHPYLFIKYYEDKNSIPPEKGALSEFLTTNRIPRNGPNDRSPKEDGSRYNNPIIINEYAWLWLNRDGSTTTLTDRVYDVVFGKSLTKEERLYNYTRYLSMLTEYWRAHRRCAGILHFCGLGYSRPDEPRGQTSDHFIDIQNLTLEPEFVKYVKPAFSPVGLMINFWDKNVSVGHDIDTEVYIINDLSRTWEGDVKISVRGDSGEVHSQAVKVKILPYGREVKQVHIQMPEKIGDYVIEAELLYDNQTIKSIRELSIKRN